MDKLNKILHKMFSDNKIHVVSVDSVEDRYIALSELLSRSRCVKMFSKDLSLFYQENIDAIGKQNVSFDCSKVFVDASVAFLGNTEATLEIVAECISSDYIDHIHSQIRSSFQRRIDDKGIVVKQLLPEISQVAHLGNFTLCDDLKAICIDQGNNNQLLVIHDSAFVSKALKVFDAFFSLSKAVDIESNTKD